MGSFLCYWLHLLLFIMTIIASKIYIITQKWETMCYQIKIFEGEYCWYCRFMVLWLKDEINGIWLADRVSLILDSEPQEWIQFINYFEHLYLIDLKWKIWVIITGFNVELQSQSKQINSTLINRRLVIFPMVAWCWFCQWKIQCHLICAISQILLNKSSISDEPEKFANW